MVAGLMYIILGIVKGNISKIPVKKNDYIFSLLF